jgi:hypothetical protein
MASLSSAAWLFGAGSLIESWGMLEQGRSARIAGERAKVSAEFMARQADEEAGIAIALAQRRALEEQRQGELQASRALAVAAASGGGVSDPTIVNLLANIKGEAVYRANIALYEGEAQARRLRLEAAAGRLSGSYAQIEGARAEQGYAIGAAGTVFRGGAAVYSMLRRDRASLYDRYGMGGPSGDAALIAPSWQG